MRRFLQRGAAAFRRDRTLPFPVLAKKAAVFLTSAVKSGIALRGCDGVGVGARVSGTPRIVNRGSIHIGDELVLMSRWNPVELIAGEGAAIEIGNQVAINYGTSIRASHSVRIGDKAMIGQYCIIADTEVPEPVVGSERISAIARPVVIGEGAWLAGRVTVLPGVTIGEGSVVTAGSIVASDIPPGVLAGGIPARVVRRLDGAAPGHASAPPPPRPEVPVTHKGLVVADFTVEELTRRLSDRAEAPGIDVQTAPYGQVVQTLLQRIPPERADFAVIWTRPDSALPSFARAMRYEPVTQPELEADVDAFCNLVTGGTAQLKAVFVPAWTLPPWRRAWGMLDARPGGATWALNVANARLAHGLASAQNAYVLSAQRWIDSAGHGHSAKGWYLGKVPFATGVFEEAAAEIKAALRGLAGQARKLVIVDLDDTLWGGIVGDVGWENLRLGGHDAVGEAFVEFQQMLKALTKRGVVLGIVSKNTESVALEAIDKHPEMALRRSDFVGWRINWQDKARNVAELAASLRLGLQSVVFLDDNPVERARVREALPEVLVPEWPEDKVMYPVALGTLRCFDAPALSKEDAERTRMYAEEKARDELRAEVPDFEAFLRKLQIKVRVDPLGAANVARVAQLLNKTNQMNLATRRLTEGELTAWLSEPGRALWAVTVADRLGDAGLTGIVSVERDGQTARIIDFVLSCRVMGRRVEQTMLHVAAEHARKAGLAKLEARFVPTPKNKPCLEFLVNESGLAQPAPNVFVWDAAKPYALPAAIALEGKP